MEEGVKMKSVAKVMDQLGVGEEVAIGLIDKAREYANPGKGLVFKDHKTIERVAGLFVSAPIWLNRELNQLVGWQFSQAVYHLRRSGWKIKTVCLGKSQYAYQLVEVGPGYEVKGV